jgi:hypothetical protein
LHNIAVAIPNHLEIKTMKHLRINPDRLWQSLMSLAAIGATSKGGVCRLALTDLDRQGRDLVKQWCEQAGCQVRVDAIGNIFARREGLNSKRLPVATGSHIDTQPTGGKFDGNYGVLAGIEVIRKGTQNSPCRPTAFSRNRRVCQCISKLAQRHSGQGHIYC